MKDKQLTIISETDESVLYALEGCRSGDSAVLITWGYSIGKETGGHNFADSFAIAELGHLDEDLKFELLEMDVCSQKDTLVKEMIGKPMEYSIWNPEEETQDIDWDSMKIWMERYAVDVLK